MTLRGAQDFHNLINNMGSIDFILNRLWFTWRNNRVGDGLLAERLDRVLLLSSWLDQYLHTTVETLNISTSDHIPILVS